MFGHPLGTPLGCFLDFIRYIKCYQLVFYNNFYNPQQFIVHF